LQVYDHLFGAFFTNIEISTNRPTSTSWKIGNQPLIAYISIGGNKYGPDCIDDYSRFSWVFFLQDKGETQEVLKKFMKRAQNEFDAKIKRIRSDNGIEF
jgi:hypothetical protein